MDSLNALSAFMHAAEIGSFTVAGKHLNLSSSGVMAVVALGVFVVRRHIPLSGGSQSSVRESLHRIVVVGGGAAGLELVTRLGDRLGRRSQAAVTLVECARTHLWKPLLHAVAAGSLDPGEYEVN